MTSYVQAATLWWDGRLRTGVALRLDPATGTATPVTEVPAAESIRTLPGTLLPGLVDAHVHAGLVDLATVRAGGIAGVWDLGGVPSFLAGLTQPGLPAFAMPDRF
ncbi:hypothetical protein [Paractinoplanes durhamensis]|uniref:hypothetical protein n=1 Tax=Paractinoplanes durhamensis TaxID=113563 RepID=UPI0036360982